ERLIQRKRCTEGRGRTHSETLRNGQRRFAQDFDLERPRTGELLDDALRDRGLLAALIHHDVEGGASRFPDLGDRPDTEAQGQPGTARSLRSEIRVLMD